MVLNLSTTSATFVVDSGRLAKPFKRGYERGRQYLEAFRKHAS